MQSQLLRILDLVPDSVFICTKMNDKSDFEDPESLFANHKMNLFFGRRVIKSVKRRSKRVKKKYSKDEEDQDGETHLNPLKRKIFSTINLTDISSSANLSLFDVVQINQQSAHQEQTRSEASIYHLD